MESQAKLYNECNPKDDSYCIFEMQYKELKPEYDRTVSELNTYKIKLGETLAVVHIANEQIVMLEQKLDEIRKSLHDYYDDVNNKTFMEFVQEVKNTLKEERQTRCEL